MVKVSYHVLGAAVFVLGVLLEIRIPGHELTMGENLFQDLALPKETSFGLSYSKILAIVLQMSGILIFIKWINEEHPKVFKIYRKMEPIFLAALIFGTPFLFNALFDTGARTYAYSNKSGSEAVEFLEDKSRCDFNQDKGMIDCTIILKNYQHSSQPITIYFKSDFSDKKEWTVPAYLQAREQKSIYLELPSEEFNLNKGIPEFWIESN